MAAMPLPDVPEGGSLPKEIHLVPAPTDGMVYTSDGRGPYKMTRTPAEVIAASFARADKIEIDINHATYHAAPKGMRSDSYGWITAMHAREDGIWGTVEWTKEGAELVRNKAYRAISPALLIDATDKKTIVGIGNASLVNRPNLRGLVTLHTEETSRMEGMSKIAEKLGLGADATLEQILAKIGSMSEKSDAKPDAALQSALTEIGTTVGLPSGTPDAIVAAVKVKAGAGTDVVALQAELTTVKGQLTELQTSQKRTASEAYVDGEMKKGRTGITAANRETLITLHMSQPDQAKTIIEAQPIVTPTAVIASVAPPTDKDGNVQLNAQQLDAATKLGLDPKAYAKTLAEEAR
jgi:phage I-like protein